MVRDHPLVLDSKPQAVISRKEKIFFPNLDGLRFFSFFSVYLFHVYLLLFDKYQPGTGSHRIMRFLFQNGEIGVNFFFVLSGFLITYLLIEEKKLTGKIHIGNFYIRRILRIWPLFYLCLIFGFVIYPFIKNFSGGELFVTANPWTYFVFLNNFDFLYNGAPAIISVLWSVAIEEQFYLMWPLVLGLLPLKKFSYAFFIIIAGSIIFRAFNVQHERVLQFHTLAVIGDMALGGLLAYYCIFNTAFKQAIVQLSKPAIACIYLAALAVFFFRKEVFTGILPVVERIIIASIFGMIILEQNFSKNSFFKMSRWKVISKMGTYTYGLYCLHVIAMTITEMGLSKAGLNIKETLPGLLVGFLAIFVVTGIALASYHLFEKRFLRLKDRFAFIVKK
ncbi:MAG: acyltransferase [Chitinophagaceae bacterium]